MSAVLPPKWCGVEHPHDMHQWAEPVGLTGMYRYCPGSSTDLAGALRALAENKAVLRIVRESHNVAEKASEQWLNALADALTTRHTSPEGGTP